MTQSRLEHALTDWEQQKIPFGVLMIDIDFFKRVNDSYGHDTGDQVLKMTAGSLSGGLRSYDFLGRWGGEEFLAIVTNINLAGLKRIAERMRMLVETSLIFLNGNDRSIERAVRITVSGGGAIIRAGETLEALINRADRSLYQSKNSGRNRVTIDEGEPALTDRP
jgi:diguanylate cyclase (GGDEF)-like protein